ncbi:unnamed protein product [Clonostachys byssicola]|uniref:Xylose isomerase-like TIM barrel domain-containing protein n=1 Tax=Clonostachys byssicola TaxID=160290 RepID=A0A9N9UPF3_9HYPO|nr:unnamed protein product [Clonostachys byssicola]
MASVLEIPVAFASCSIGLPKHTLHEKIEAIAQSGFKGVEISFPDIQSFGHRHLGFEINEHDYTSLCKAATAIGELCRRHDIKVLVLQPFSNFEGWPKGSQERRDAFARARGWIDIMTALGTDMLQVGSTDSPNITSDVDQLAGDLAELADLLAERGYRLAYENWCWATHATTWKDVWDIVQRANRDNIGLCLDTFQTAGGEWGDPTTSSGKLENGLTEAELDETFRKSLQELSNTVPADRIYFLQISDAYRMAKPLSREPDESGLRPRGRWSHDYRPLPFDGGYLPIEDFVKAVLATGFRGWFSIEVFDGQFEKKYGDNLFKFAEKAMEGHRRLISN